MTVQVTLVGLAVFAAAAIGAGLRYLAAEWLNVRIPYGTLVANIVASFLLGALSQSGESMMAIAGVGALGALSTWSTVANEVAALARAQEGLAAALYLWATVSTGVLAAWFGLQVAMVG